MANELIKLKTGSLSKMNDANGGLSQVAIDKGTVYFATDSTTKAGKIWFDTTDGKRIDMTAFSQESINAITADNVSGTVAIANGGTGATTATAAKENLGLGNAKIFHGTCDTAAATVAKVVTCDEFKTTDLIKGAIIFVTFDNTNSGNVKNITLNVNGTGAKSIKQMYNGAIANFSNTNNILADQTYSFTYDGTNWVCGNVDTNNSWSVMSADELKAGTATSNRIMRASYIKSAFTASDGIFQPGSADGTISIYGQDLAVTGLGSAAFTESSTYATKTEVNGLLAAADAMVFKGTIAGTSTSPGAYTPAANCGDTYKVSTAGYINGQKVEIGDMFICTADSTVAATSSNYSTVQNTWTIVQTNTDGVVIGPASSVTSGHIATFDGSTGKLIKDSGYTIAKSVPSNAKFTDTNYYHTTGSWNGLTYTATANGGAGALEFTLPTGTTATTVAAGNHEHTIYPKWQTTTKKSTELYDLGLYVNKNSAASTGPTGGNYFTILNFPYAQATGNTKAYWGWQIGGDTNNNNRLFFRTTGDNVFGDWQEIAHATRSGSNIGSATQPVYMTSAGVITAGTALKALAYKDSLTAGDVGAAPTSHTHDNYMVKGVDYVTAGKASGITMGNKATAEGSGTMPTGSYAHAEGGGTTASGAQSHAEGGGTTASNENAHAEGGGTVASGTQSHAEGSSTTANHRSQHVFGEYNIADSSTAAASSRGNYVEIVGNGASNAYSNARTLDWAGNEVLAGSLTVGAAQAVASNESVMLQYNSTTKSLDFIFA